MSKKYFGFGFLALALLAITWDWNGWPQYFVIWGILSAYLFAIDYIMEGKK